MAFLVISLLAFVLAHTALSRPRLRDRMTASMGRSGYGAVNGVIALAALGVVFWAHREAPYIELWPTPPAARLVPVVAMPIACILAVAGLSTPCAGLGGDRLPDGDMPAPGILGITRHPLPMALVVWAASHIAANGDMAAVLVFGTFFAFAAIAPRLVDRRRARLCGIQAWSNFAAATSTVPFAAAIGGRAAVDWRGIGWVRPAAGVVLYFGLIFLHPWLSGVAVTPELLAHLPR